MKSVARFAKPLGLVTAFLVVVACGGGGSSIGAPSIPNGLTAAPGNGQVVLSWTPSNGATHYNVKRSLSVDGPYTVVAGPSIPAYTDNRLTNGTTYYYVVSADSTFGESGNSSVVSATPQP